MRASKGESVTPSAVVASTERSSSHDVAPAAVVVAAGLGEEERTRLQEEKAEMQDKYIESQKVSWVWRVLQNVVRLCVKGFSA